MYPITNFFYTSSQMKSTFKSQMSIFGFVKDSVTEICFLALETNIRSIQNFSPRSSLLYKITQIHLKCCIRSLNNSFACTLVILRFSLVDNLLLPVQKRYVQSRYQLSSHTTYIFLHGLHRIVLGNAQAFLLLQASVFYITANFTTNEVVLYFRRPCHSFHNVYNLAEMQRHIMS